MPEARYIFFVSLSYYLVLMIPAKPIRNSWKWVFAAGLSLALNSLVKPHALFLVLGFALFLLFAFCFLLQNKGPYEFLSG